MLGELYDQALDGEQCWIRHDDGRLGALPVHRWLGGPAADHDFDSAVVDLCESSTIELGCGPARLVARLHRGGIPALGVDQSATAVRLARRSGARVLLRDVFEPLPGAGTWGTVLLIDGNIGLGGDPRRILGRAARLLRPGGCCLAEFDGQASGIDIEWVRLESSSVIGPWFRWASVGLDSAAALAEHVGLAVTGVHPVGRRVVVSLHQAGSAPDA